MNTEQAPPQDLAGADFDAFVRSRMPSLLRAAYLLTGDQHLAEDLVQTALARTHLAWRRLRDTGNADAYTRKTMYHAQVSLWRRRRAAESLPGTLPEPPTPDPTAAVALRLSVRTALGQVTPKQRALLVLRYLEDRSEAETAEVLGIAIGTVKSETSRALQRMRDLGTGLLTEESAATAAQGVRPADLEPGIAATARGITRRRRAVAVVAAAVALLVLGGVATAMRPRGSAAPANPAPSTIPSDSASPTPTVEPAPIPPGRLAPAIGPVPAFGCLGVSVAARTATSLPGRVTFWHLDDARNCLIVSTLEGGRVRDIASVPLGKLYGTRSSLRLSPDGTRLAWITNDDDNRGIGELAVATVGGSGARLLGAGVIFSGGNGPRWEPDSRHLIVNTFNGGPVRVDAETGLTQVGHYPGPYPTFSPSGIYLTYGDAGDVVVEGPDGAILHRFAYDGPHTGCECGFSTQEVADDGRYVAVSYRNTDPSTVRGGFQLLDVVDRREVILPIAAPIGSTIRQIVFQPGGGALVVTRNGEGRATRVYLLGSGYTVSSQTPVPELDNALVLSVRR